MINLRTGFFVVLTGLAVLSFACSDEDSTTATASNTSASNMANADAGVETDATIGGSDAEDSDSANPDTGGEGDTGIEPQSWPVDAPGPFNVGFRSLTTTYTTIDDEERSLRTVVWYPTQDTEGSPSLYGGLLPRDEALRDASLAAPLVEGSYPLMIFSHGNGGFAEQSFFLSEYLTSHGWVCIAMDHTGNTFNDSEALPEILYLRPLDISAVLDNVLALPEEDPLSGLIGDDIVVTGHSFGGYTTLTAAGAGFQIDQFFSLCDNGTLDEENCAPFRPEHRTAQLRAGFLDDRIDLAIPMSPGAVQLLGAGIADITMPTLLFTSTLDETTTNAQDGDPAWRNLSADSALRVDFQTGGHFTFSNACDALGGFVDGDGCGEGFIDSLEAHDAITTYSLAFIRFHLWGDTEVEGILNGDVEVNSDVVLSTKP